ncbi:MAG: DUF6510 family protein [Acidimicrobiia bacterium]
MTTDTHLDGNCLGALWYDMFGREMTDQRGCCDNCGNVAALATAMVFRDAPGDVVRCSKCESVLLVAVSTPSGLRVNWAGLRWVELRA